MIDLKLPQSTVVDKPIPKNAFYKHLEVNAKMKQHFVDDVVNIRWAYKIAPTTLNVADGKYVHEIVFFLAGLKSIDCPDDVFLFIDQNMPRHIVFILEYKERYKILLNYKEWKEGQSSHFKIVKTFSTDWLDAEQLSLSINGQTMDSIYETMAGQISGFGTSKSEDTKRIIELEALIKRRRQDVETLQKKIRNEQQLNRQIEMNGEARTHKKQIDLWQKELQELKPEK